LEQALWAPPRGNAYLILAKAFIAAQLNGLNDAAMDDVADEYAAAAALLGQYDPSNVEAKAKDARALRAVHRARGDPRRVQQRLDRSRPLRRVGAGSDARSSEIARAKLVCCQQGPPLQ
jgi:hypothetical protein